MFKKLLLITTAVAVFVSQGLVGFADELLAEDVIAGGDMYYESMYYPGMGGFTLNVSLKAEAEADDVILYADYYYSGTEFATREEVIEHLTAMAEEVKERLAGSADVVQNGLNVYSYSYYEEEAAQYEGYLNLMVDMQDLNDLAEVKEVLSARGFNYWMDVVVSEEAKIDAEFAIAAELKALIDKKRTVYETILGYALTNITGLSVYSWPDSMLYNPETGMVPLSVYADVTYDKGMDVAEEEVGG